jgi:hypothetical protein
MGYYWEIPCAVFALFYACRRAPVMLDGIRPQRDTLLCCNLCSVSRINDTNSISRCATITIIRATLTNIFSLLL